MKGKAGRAQNAKARQLAAARAMQTEVEAIAAAMIRYEGNLAKVSMSLGITENLLKLKMSAYGLRA